MEQNKRVCKVCMREHMRIYSGKWNGKDKAWRDENGLIWNGKVCGVCNRVRVRDAMHKLREKRNEKIEDSSDQQGK